MPRYIRKKNGVTVWNCLGNKGCHCFVSSLNTDFHGGVGEILKIMLQCLGMEHDRLVIPPVPVQLVFCIHGNFTIRANNLVGGIQQCLGFLLGKALVIESFSFKAKACPAVSGYNVGLDAFDVVVNANNTTRGTEAYEDACLLATVKNLTAIVRNSFVIMEKSSIQVNEYQAGQCGNSQVHGIMIVGRAPLVNVAEGE